MQFSIIIVVFHEKSRGNSTFSPKNIHKSHMDKRRKNWYDILYAILGDETLKELRRKFERFCFQHRNVGIPNLMLYIMVGTAVVYLYSMFSQNFLLYEWMCFDRELILQGQVWRLLTYILLDYDANILWMAIGLICYYSLGNAMENLWGTLRFNLFYFTGVLMMDIYCMIFDCFADVYYLNLSLFLGFATLYPDVQFHLFFIIPVKAWILALFNLVMVLLGLCQMPFGPNNLFSVISIANYFLFFGKDVVNVLPLTWRVKVARMMRKKGAPQSAPKRTGTVQFPNAAQQRQHAVRQDYTHRCTVCGRTDVTHPELEFRYCSKCNGYHCYCQDHISNHDHITE